MDAKGGRARVPISDPWPQTIANGGVQPDRTRRRARHHRRSLGDRDPEFSSLPAAFPNRRVAPQPEVDRDSRRNLHGRVRNLCQRLAGRSSDLAGERENPVDVGQQFRRTRLESRGRRTVSVSGTADGGGAGFTRFTAEARGDLDGDGEPSFWAFVKPDQNGGLGGSFVGTTCDGSGVVSGGSSNAIEAPGACDPSSGRSVF